MDYSLKANAKRLSGSNHPDRDQQFRYIASQKQAYRNLGLPTISVDVKKKELIGNFKNPGQEWCLEARAVNDHDFETSALGKAVPYGIYDLAHNRGYVYVGKAAVKNTLDAQEGVGVAAISIWDLDTMMQNNAVYTANQRELKKRGGSAQAFVSWLIYSATPAAARLTDPVGNAVARLLDSPKTGAGGACSILAALPPQEFKAALEKDLRGGIISTSGYSIALKKASGDVKTELLQRLFGTQQGVVP